MAEDGIDISAATPKVLTTEAVRSSDVCITMGCGDVCPVFPGKRYLDWTLDDPAGQGVDAVRPIRDEIRRRVTGLLAELGVRPVYVRADATERGQVDVDHGVDAGPLHLEHDGGEARVGRVGGPERRAVRLAERRGGDGRLGHRREDLPQGSAEFGLGQGPDAREGDGRDLVLQPLELFRDLGRQHVEA